MKFLLIFYTFFVYVCLSLTFAENLRKNGDNPSNFKLISLNGILDSENTDINAVAMSSTGKIIYASSYHSYLYKSADYGKTWQAITDVSNVGNIATTPSGRIVYVTQVNPKESLWVLKSTDFGETWSTSFKYGYFDSELYNDPNPFPIAISASGQYVYSSSFDFFMSNDYGESFTHHTIPRSDDNYYYNLYLSPTAIAVSRTGRYAYYVNEVYFYARSTNYGAKFELFPQKFLQYDYASAVGCTESGKIVYIADSKHGNIYKSNNFGYTFTKLSQIPANTYTAFNSIVTSKDGSIVYVANEYGPIYQSTDSALSFDELPSTVLPNRPNNVYTFLSTNYKGDTLLLGYHHN